MAGDRGVGRHIAGRGDEVVDQNVTGPNEFFLHEFLAAGDLGGRAPGGKEAGSNDDSEAAEGGNESIAMVMIHGSFFL